MSQPAVVADDPFAILEQTAHRQVAEQKMLERISKARTTLIFGRNADHAFWATLALKLKVEVGWNVPTICTDGKRLVGNPDFIATVSDPELVGIVAHEVAHNALNFHGRKGNRDHDLFNVAHDLAINPLLLEAGFKLPKSRLMPGEGEYKDIPVGLAGEEIYNLLLQKQGQKGKPGGGDGEEGDGEGEGPGQGDPGGCGTALKAGDGSESAAREAQAEWEVNVAQAAQIAKQRGKLSAGLERFVHDALTPIVDWREVLREFVTKSAKNEYRWSPPNRRFVHQRLFLPSMGGEALGHIIAMVDTSGSIGQAEINLMGGELQGILSAWDDVELTILYHDSQVCHVQKWSPADGPLVMEPKGGGGTDHRPCFAWIEENESDPVCVVALTDLCSTFPEQEPDFPMLWATTVKGSKGPFGRTVEIV